jgi:peptidoglycan/LPS O-acetylase OafA/YrhL
MLNETAPEPISSKPANSFQTRASTGRLSALDSVRGIASFIVMIAHCYWILVPYESRHQLDLSIWSRPIRLITAGDAAVIIFFVLSGYVLALPFFRGTQPGYLRYLSKRVCRIYIPFAVAIAVAALLSRIPDAGRIVPGATRLFNIGFQEWLWPGPSILARHFLMNGTEHDIGLDPVMWSLVYEMRVSLIFPLLIILCRDTRLALIIAAITEVGSTKILAGLGQSSPTTVANFWVTFLWTARVVPYFVAGILLSKHSVKIRLLMQRVPIQMSIALMVLPLMIFTIEHDYISIWRNALFDVGAALIIVVAVDVPPIAATLNQSVLQWLGRISYSMYLVHLPILLLIFYGLLGRVPFGFIPLAGIAASLCAATLMHRFVEVPAIRLGQRVARGAHSTPPLAAPESGEGEPVPDTI